MLCTYVRNARLCDVMLWMYLCYVMSVCNVVYECCVMYVRMLCMYIVFVCVCSVCTYVVYVCLLRMHERNVGMICVYV